MGRPTIEVTPEMIAEAERLAGHGHNNWPGIKPAALYARKLTQPKTSNIRIEK